MKTALITGASNAIGLELAKIFAAKGVTLFWSQEAGTRWKS